MEEKWEVELDRLIELIAERMYTDPVKAGIRELITNSLDARKGRVEIEINYNQEEKLLQYLDTGTGIDPPSFREVYGKIASAHQRREDSRGFFGLGRMSLIAASQEGKIVSYRDGLISSWQFNREGWKKVEERRETGREGVYIEFMGLEIENLDEIKSWIRKAFSIPLFRGECRILLNNEELTSIINLDWGEEEIRARGGRVHLYYREEGEGQIRTCHRGIFVREEAYPGLLVYADQDFLDIKTDREGFVNNEKNRLFKQIVKRELSKLRPRESFERVEVDFVRRLMKGFRRHWLTIDKQSPPRGSIELEFPGEITITRSTPSKGGEGWGELPLPGEREEGATGPQEESSGGGASEGALPSEEKIPYQPGPPGEEGGKKVVSIRGAVLVELGENYPVIFFESDPFTLVFNTSHPLFKGLIERGKLGNQELALLFERMMEAAFLNENPTEGLERVKERWSTVDKRLISLFRR